MHKRMPVLPVALAALLVAVLAKAASPALPPGVRRLADLAYGPDPAQRLDVYLPARPDGSVLLMVHGGGWRGGDKALPSVVANKLAHWAARGTVLVAIDYRLLPQADPLQQAGDVAAALAWTQRHARMWGGDPARVVLMGHSAGAHLVALLSAEPALARAHGAARWAGTVALDSAALNVPALMRAPHLPLYDAAFGTTVEYWRAAAPTLQLTPAGLPILLVCSSGRAESCDRARAHAARAQRLGVRAQVLPEALSHRQINDSLGLPGAYTTAVDAFLASLARPR
jgi:acetyl esterase/lipase